MSLYAVRMKRILEPFVYQTELGQISGTSKGKDGLAILEERINRKQKVLCRKTTDETEAQLRFVGRSGVASPLTPI